MGLPIVAVAGIGIMNIILVSVSERTQETGIRASRLAPIDALRYE